MNYKLFKFHLGTSKLDLTLEFSSLFEIEDITYIDSLGIVLLFKKQHCLGLIDKNNRFIFPWAGEPDKTGFRDSTAPLFEYPSSACYCNASKNLFVVEKGGMRIRKMELDPFYCSSVFGNAVQKKMANYFINFPDIGGISTYCCADKNGDIYWSIRELNRCFKYEFNLSDFEPYIGNGKYGFSVSSNFRSSLVAYPSGLLCLGDSVYIADSGNHCIREGLRVVAGSPNRSGCKDNLALNASLDFPTKIISLKKLICFKDIDRIGYYSTADKLIGTLHVSSNVVAIDSDAKDLIVLEK